MYPRPSLSSSTSDATIPGPSLTLPPNIDYQNPTEPPRITIEHYTGCAPPDNCFYYPPYMAKDFEQLSPTKLEKREKSGLNSLPESRGSLKLQRVSSWRSILRAAIKGSPKKKLTLNEIRHALYTRFPGLGTTLSSDNVIRHTLSFCKEFSVKDSYWTVGSDDSITQKIHTNKTETRMGRPPKMDRNVPYASSLTVFSVTKTKKRTGKTARTKKTKKTEQTGSTNTTLACDQRLPGCKDLLKITDTIHPVDVHDHVNPSDIFGCRGLIDMINQQTPDLRTIARRCELDHENNWARDVLKH